MSTKPLESEQVPLAAGEPHEYLLEVLSGPDLGRSARVRGPFIVGSQEGADLVLSDPTVSRRHLGIELSAQGAVVKDLQSSNGTFLSGSRTTQFLVKREETFAAGATLMRLTYVDRTQPQDQQPLSTFGGTVGVSPKMVSLFHLLKQVASSDSTVIVLGETGTGKEALARGIHAQSPRAHKPFVVVDCGAIAPGLVESELFGHTKGSFTGATQEREGAVMQANGGTLFLDEIGELPLELQPKLLRFLEAGVVKPVGSDEQATVDVRIIAATHRDLDEDVKAGRFRSDLYYRLAVVVVRVPPLRERLEDIPVIVRHFLAQMGRPDFALPPELLEQLRKHPWPGNVRELRNVVERAVNGGEVMLSKLSPAQRAGASADLAELPFKEAKELLVESFMREYFEALFERSGRNISEMARLAGIARTYAHRLVKKYGLKESGG